METSPLIHLQIPSHNGHISSTSLFSSSNSVVPPLRIQNQHYRGSPLRCSGSSNGRPSGPTDKDSERILEEKRRAELAARIASGEFTVPESGLLGMSEVRIFCNDDFDELERLVYLKAALAETLRLYPSVPQDVKYVVEDDMLPDGTPAGSAITYSIYSVGRMESIWGKDCMKFKPERWMLVEGDRFEPVKDSYRFVAFNGGPRTCLGKDLVYLQMKPIASAVLLRHKVVLVPGHKVQQKMSPTLFMKNRLRVHVKPRNLKDYVSARLSIDTVDPVTNGIVTASAA